jgi:hypothetical protein
MISMNPLICDSPEALFCVDPPLRPSTKETASTEKLERVTPDQVHPRPIALHQVVDGIL